MADDGGAAAASPAPEGHGAADLEGVAQRPQTTPLPMKSHSRMSTMDYVSGAATPMSGHHRRQSGQLLDLSLDDYFIGPRDLDHHSKLPYFLRLQGSVMPRMILPIIAVSGWSTLITCISKYVHPLQVNTVLLTVLGFIVGLALSFRTSTAYERYSDGRKAWATLSVQSRNLARCFWFHIDEREGDDGKNDLLSKLTAINLLLAFAVSLKHKLRFEPYAHYPDISSLVSHLDTFAKSAYMPGPVETPHIHWYKKAGIYLGLTFAESNPRKTIKRADKPLGNLPLEILGYLSGYVDETTRNGTLKTPIVMGQMLTSIALLTDVQSSAERVLTTPLPVGYSILISQITLLYVYLLPFQLFGPLGWVTIPGTIAAAYIILGLAAIGNELENPFGNDVNDLPLDGYCEELRREFDFLTSRAPVRFGDLLKGSAQMAENKVLWPISAGGVDEWQKRSVQDIRSALHAKVLVGAGQERASSSGTSLESKRGEASLRVQSV